MTLRNYNKYLICIIVFLLSIIIFIPRIHAKLYEKPKDKLAFLRGSS
ncbi:MAG: TlpA family protein disulfide reductase, partial [Rickettsia conorii subsp. raoultii]